MFDLRLGDCLEKMAGIPESSVDLILTDPPYFKVKTDAWDRQWEKPRQFLAWLDLVLEQFQRILKPNGSLYLFASPQMAARVEVLMAERFCVLNGIVWRKESGRHKAACKESLRSYFPQTERIIFAEHYGADNMAKGEAGYVAKCDELRGFVFEPLRSYLAGEWERAGLTARDANIATGSQMAGHWLTSSQWVLPTREKYEQLRQYANSKGGDYLRREYDYLRREYDYLRREYDYLRREYDDLRRPFGVTAAVPYTDVWDFDVVPAYPGKHPCEKPQKLLQHIIKTSSREGALVFDAFAGSGSTGLACAATGRRFIGCELSEQYHGAALRRIAAAYAAAGQAGTEGAQCSAALGVQGRAMPRQLKFDAVLQMQRA